jgi:hypothetical protein
MQVGAVEIALPQRRKYARVLGVCLSHVGPSRCGPAGYLVSQRLCCAGVTARGGEDRLPVVE